MTEPFGDAFLDAGATFGSLPGVARTRQDPSRPHTAALPPAVMPTKVVQCQQGRAGAVHGEKYMVGMMHPDRLAGRTSDRRLESSLRTAVRFRKTDPH